MYGDESPFDGDLDGDWGMAVSRPDDEHALDSLES
jgi:hypothetical protein